MFDQKNPQQSSVLQLGPFSEGLYHLICAFCFPNTLEKSLPAALTVRMCETRKKIRMRLLSRGLSRRGVFAQPLDQRLAGASMSIIVAIHDAPLVTKRCLLSLERYATNSEVILVDDGSRRNETIDLIRGFSSRNGWTAIRNEEARGHSAACATGASVASRPYLCLLNSDTLVTPWCWRPIAEAFETNAAIGVVGPSTSASDNEQTIDVAWHYRFHWNDDQITGFARKLATVPPQPAIVDLPWAGGFAFFIRRNLWQKVGGFDSNLRDYGNEIDLCERVINLGYRVAWVRSSYIHHLRHQSYANQIGEHGILSQKAAASEYIRQRRSRSPANGPAQL
jgi:GT2 family glycosyltransferase